MPLTREDLNAIRAIVREEITRANRPRATSEDELEPAEEAAIRERAHRAAARMIAARTAVPPPIPDTPYLNRYDAARLLDVMPDTITTYARQGLLAKHGTGRSWTVARAELDAMLAARRKVSGNS